MSRVIVVGLSFCHSVSHFFSHSVIFFMQDFSQTTSADGNKFDMKDEDRGLYALMCCFCHYSVRSTVSMHTAGSMLPKISRKLQLLLTLNLI